MQRVSRLKRFSAHAPPIKAASDLDATQRFLRQTLHDFITNTRARALPRRINWRWLEKFGLQQGFFAILRHQLPPGMLPQKTAQCWQQASIAVWMQNQRALQATCMVVKRLEAQRISVVALRGMVLAHTVYPDPMLRPMADVDLLIPSRASQDFTELIRAGVFGPVRSLRSQFVFGVKETKFEVHWSFLTPKRYRNAADFDGWPMDRRLCQTHWGRLPCLSPEKELLGLVLHWCLHHELEGFLRAIDIALFIGKHTLNWDYIQDWCARNALTRVFCFTIAYIDFLFALNLSGNLRSPKEHLPKSSPILFSAYLAHSLGQDCVTAILRRKKNLLFLSESPGTKLRQLLRYFDLYDYIHAGIRARLN